MMNRIRQLLNGNTEKYAYLITDEKKFRNQHYACLIVALFTFVPAIILWHEVGTLRLADFHQ
ncbi:hypothetical protein [[Clostridium] innocuum]|uniref:hypothetical protein n=1 Tax=Clostridium innocuum TaxID=1522 RepID=UPI001FCB8CFC|nr:hypothetical protein [[Clostridium] innocuum]BDF00769.1 hypothetical protein CE91St51_28060 [[Clostridium] innocuum]